MADRLGWVMVDNALEKCHADDGDKIQELQAEVELLTRALDMARLDSKGTVYGRKSCVTPA